MKRLTLLVTPLLALSFLASCNKGGGDNPPPEPTKDTYDITFEGQFCTINGDFNFSDTVIKNKNAKYTIVPSDGYNLPETISMPSDINYQYDKDTGVISIDKVTKDINKITATAILDDSYRAFHFEGTNCSISGIKNFDDTVKKGATNIKYTISPDIGYELPSKVEPEDKVSYDNITGVITISEMTSDISITAETTETIKTKYNVNFIGTDCTATGGSIISQDIFNIYVKNTEELNFEIVPAPNYELTDDINFEIDNEPADPSDYSYLPETGDTGNYILKFYPKGETLIGIDAILKADKCTVTFDSNGGSEVKAISVTKGNKIDSPIEPVREGYALEGWYYDDDVFEYKFDFATTAIYQDIELHANWQVADVIITFYAGGSSAVCEANFDSKYVLGVMKGTKWKDIACRIYGAYQSPVVSPLEFLYWHFADSSEPISDDYVFNQSVSLHAKYTEVSKNYLTLTPRSNATLTIDPPGDGTRTFSYQKTGDTSWTQFTSSTTVTLNYGQQIYIKGSDNDAINKDMFISNNYFTVSGPCASLFKDSSSLPEYAFAELFYKIRLIAAHNLSLPKTTLTKMCYFTMFHNNSSLISAPRLAATTLASGAYMMMFSGCSNLKISNEDEEGYVCDIVLIAPSSLTKEHCGAMFADTAGVYQEDEPKANETYRFYN